MTKTDSAYATPEGTVFQISGNRVIFPTPEHEYGGGVALTDEVASVILAFPGSGTDEDSQLEWDHTGESKATRVGTSKEIEITQTSFGRERTVYVTLVDIADATVEL